MASDRPLCSGITKAGKPCRSWAVKDGMCAGHAGLGVASDPAYHRQRQLEQDRVDALKRHEEAERLKMYAQAGVRGALALRLGERIEDVVRVLVDEAIEQHDRPGLRASVDQAFGKPTERVEHHDESVLDLESMTPAQLAAMKRALLDDQLFSRRLRDEGVTSAA